MYLTIDSRGGLAVLVVRAGLFDQMDDWMVELGPREADVVGELAAAGLSSSIGVVLDVRAAGRINHRTLALVVRLVRALKDLGARVAVCGTADFVEIWDGICKLGEICPAYADEQSACLSMRPVDHEPT